MVLESLLSLKKIRREPWDMFVLTVFYTAVGTALAYVVFPSEVSLTMVFLTTIALVPMLVNLLKTEEKNEIVYGKPIIKTHLDILGIFFFMFLGMLCFFTILAVAVPEHVFESLFSKQILTIKNINNLTGSAVSLISLETILSNNFKVLFFVIIFSFLYGAGAIFILSWNASVLGAAIGDFIRNTIASLGNGFYSYFHAVPLALGTYMLHGTLEFIAYFLGAIAGGIISAAVVRHDYKSPKFIEILLDSIDLIIIASITLIVAGIVEVAI